MSWMRVSGCWRPVLHGFDANEESLCKIILSAPWAPVDDFRSLGGNIKVAPKDFESFVEKAQSVAHPNDRRVADFAAAFGSESCIEEKEGTIDYTDFCFITGSGHQDFLGTMDKLAEKVTVAHLVDALFGAWRKEERLSMRWDPSDAAEYALRWEDPGPKGAWAVWGANRLACEALPLLPSIPTDRGLRTTGFERRARQDEWTWPIWTSPAGVDTARSLLALEGLQTQTPNREELRTMGIDDIYRSQRVRVGQGANFKVSFRQSKAV